MVSWCTPSSSAIRRRLRPRWRSFRTSSCRCSRERCRRTRFSASACSIFSSSLRPTRTMRGQRLALGFGRPPDRPCAGVPDTACRQRAERPEDFQLRHLPQLKDHGVSFYRPRTAAPQSAAGSGRAGGAFAPAPGVRLRCADVQDRSCRRRQWPLVYFQVSETGHLKHHPKPLILECPAFPQSAAGSVHAGGAFAPHGRIFT